MTAFRLARTCVGVLLIRRHNPSCALSSTVRNRTLSTPRQTRTPSDRVPFHSTSSPTPGYAGTSFSDPDRTDLFYHLLNSQTEHPFPGRPRVFAVSFLGHPPSTPDSETIIGWLPAVEAGTGQHVGLHDFKENPKFRRILHDAIKAALIEGADDVQINSAVQLQQGWMHIHDNRNLPPLGRIGDPDDILATVLVRDGKILADTYEEMPAYRVCTSDGLTQLTDGLRSKLQQMLTEKSDNERSENDHATASERS